MVTMIEAPVKVETPVEAPKEITTPLKLSEALRLGAMSTKQVFGEIGDLKETTCAIGAVYAGFGFTGYLDSGRNLLSAELRKIRISCPQPRCSSQSSLERIIIHQNDIHEIPREKIADWLESLGF